LWRTASLLLASEAEAVLIDPGIAEAEVATIGARAAALGATVTHILATHGDWDHLCGIAAFPHATAWMGPATAERVRSGQAAARIAKAAGDRGLAVAGSPHVDVVLEVGRAHQVGPFVVETAALRGHIPDGVCYRVRALNLLIVGDHLSAVEFPFATSTAAYRATLAGLIELLHHDPPATVVPGHGPVLTAAEALAIAEADLAYLRALRVAVAAVLGAGGDRLEARAAALAVQLPRRAPEDLAAMHGANADAQVAELLPDRS
jgi:glyoxylase-like metal-dependent hydrolase (beta-lactamase superfamily II)